MPPFLFATLLIVAAYLIGAIPFGYLIARSKGVDLFKVGSGNIGATNVGRVLGRKFGILVFILDFLKGAVPVALVPVLLRTIPTDDAQQLQPVDWLRVGVALAAFLGHLFPIYLKFRGGKGVATGAGTMFVLVPGPTAIALLIWLAVLSSFRIVSLASIIAAVGLCIARLVSLTVGDSFILTMFCVMAAAMVRFKHRENLVRLWHGTENRIEARPIMDFLTRSMHLVALGFWLGSAVFFNFLAAPTIFATFKEVAKSEPNDRTAYVPINTGLDDAKKEQLGNALAGAAVGPIFPIFFAFHAICGTIALITALGWWKSPGKVNRWRVYLIGTALTIVAVGWPISQEVTEIRLLRFSSDAAIALAAKSDFARWHLYSLGLNLSSAVLVFAAMILAARLPGRPNDHQSANL